MMIPHVGIMISSARVVIGCSFPSPYQQLDRYDHNDRSNEEQCNVPKRLRTGLGLLRLLRFHRQILSVRYHDVTAACRTRSGRAPLMDIDVRYLPMSGVLSVLSPVRAMRQRATQDARWRARAPARHGDGRMRQGLLYTQETRPADDRWVKRPPHPTQQWLHSPRPR